MIKNIIALNEAIHPELEPGVINHVMIQNSYRQGYKGEASRLKDLETIEYEKITEMCLEFKNILRVDHLWVLPNLTKLSLNFNKLENIENIEMLINLKVLDLSFNYIEKIENLDTLINLETLSLFNNLITKIENLENQKNLVILSIGNNKITSLDGLDRFRFFDKLKVLNLDGNPITDDNPNSRIYIASVLPNLRYYKYIYITKDEREDGNKKFVRELRDIENNQEDEIISNSKIEKERLEIIRLANSFIENFRDEPFKKLFWDFYFMEKLPTLIGREHERFIDSYKHSIIDIGRKLYNTGFEKFQERNHELELFTECSEKGILRSLESSRIIIEKFLEIKEDVRKAVRKQFIKIETLRLQGIEGSAMELTTPNDEVERLSEDYHGRIDELWETLMKQEVSLFESMEDVIAILNQSLKTMINNLTTAMNPHFKEFKQITINFCDQLLTLTGKQKDFNEISEDFQVWLNVRGGIKSAINSYKNKQIQKITLTEENLDVFASAWLRELIDTKYKDDLKRNRNKIVEINYFLDRMRELFVLTNNEVQEELVQEQLEAF